MLTPRRLFVNLRADMEKGARGYTMLHFYIVVQRTLQYTGPSRDRITALLTRCNVTKSQINVFRFSTIRMYFSLNIAIVVRIPCQLLHTLCQISQGRNVNLFGNMIYFGFLLLLCYIKNKHNMRRDI